MYTLYFNFSHIFITCFYYTTFSLFAHAILCHDQNSGKMVKHGSPYLRYALMNCCLPLINSDIVFANYYAKKRSEGKPYRVALTHVAKKLLRVIYTIQTKNVPYDRSLIR